jgi:hypothetical protein
MLSFWRSQSRSRRLRTSISIWATSAGAAGAAGAAVNRGPLGWPSQRQRRRRRPPTLLQLLVLRLERVDRLLLLLQVQLQLQRLLLVLCAGLRGAARVGGRGPPRREAAPAPHRGSCCGPASRCPWPSRCPTSCGAEGLRKRLHRWRPRRRRRRGGGRVGRGARRDRGCGRGATRRRGRRTCGEERGMLGLVRARALGGSSRGPERWPFCRSVQAPQAQEDRALLVSERNPNVRLELSARLGPASSARRGGQGAPIDRPARAAARAAIARPFPTLQKPVGSCGAARCAFAAATMPF